MIDFLLKYQWFKGIVFMLLFFLFYSCKVNKHYIEQNPSIPISFNGQNDSTSIGDFKINELFTDSLLIDLIDTAIKNNQDLLIASERITIAKSDVLFKKAFLLPSVNAKIAAGIDKYGNYTMNGVGNFDTNLSQNISKDQKIPSPTPDIFIGFQSFWEIDLWGKLKNKRNAAIKRFLASEKGRQAMITSLVGEVASLYYELMSLHDKINILKKNINLQEQGLEIMEIQQEGGKVTQLAVEQFAAQLLNTKSEEGKIQQQIAIAETRLNFLMGRFPQPINFKNTIDQQKFPEIIKAGIPSDILLRRPDIKQAELNFSASVEDLNAARKAFYPSLVLTPYVGINSFKPSLLLTSGSIAYGAITGISGPLFNRRALKSNYINSKALNRIASIEYHKLIVASFGEVINQLKGIEHYQQVANYKNEQTEKLHNAVTVSNDLFFGGYASYLEVIMAQKNVLIAEMELVEARTAQFIYLVNLYRSLGGGWQN